MLMAGQLIVFDPTTIQFGTEADDTLTADDAGEHVFGGDGDDTLQAGLGDDILVGGEGEDIFKWTDAGVSDTVKNTDTVADFELGDPTSTDKLDISAILPDSVSSSSTIEELLEYITPDVTGGNLTLHVSKTAGGDVVQDIVLNEVGLNDLGLDASATNSDILNELIKQQALTLD
ncbi:type I secretion C-terminal target domain-containing protein [Enterovibrio coralii]|uniref:type I secretion C-terminal target domain-containing protein n=1 Tax=Enterovibrio coralii TaxID=294935 RepID=UPI001E54B25D|nr:type I secretion C-terminal target domain-containing protein [Enterovibrio coralii]